MGIEPMKATRSFETSRMSYPATGRHIWTGSVYCLKNLRANVHFIIRVRFRLITDRPGKSACWPLKRKVTAILFFLEGTLLSQSRPLWRVIAAEAQSRQGCCTTCELYNVRTTFTTIIAHYMLVTLLHHEQRQAGGKLWYPASTWYDQHHKRPVSTRVWSWMNTEAPPRLNTLKTKRRPLYLKTQSVPRCKHFSSRL
jgi:hypothetical protein